MTWSGPRASEGVSGAAAQFHGRGSIARRVCLRVVGVAEVDGRRLAQKSATRIPPKPRDRLCRRGLALEETVRDDRSQGRCACKCSGAKKRRETVRGGKTVKGRGKPASRSGVGNGARNEEARTRRWKASRIGNAAVSSRGSRGVRSRLSRQAPVRAKAPPEATGERQGGQRFGRVDSPRGRERPRRRKSRRTRRSEPRCRETPSSPQENGARAPLRIGSPRGAGARSTSEEKQKSVGRISRRAQRRVARRTGRAALAGRKPQHR